MKIRTLIGTLATAGLALGVGQLTATAVPGDGGTSDSQAGPDVIVGAIPDVSKYGAATVNGVNIMGYAFGSTSCNIGTQQLDWYSGTSDHPIIPQNAYRIKNGRIEQIGMSWMKHGFCALQQTLCGPCASAGSGCPSLLGIGCSDPYTSGLNGSQTDLGPRFEANPSTGYFPATGSTTWPSIPAGQSSIARRVQIKASDLDPAQNAGSVYLAECQYVHPQDAANNNDNNNASYRVFTVGALSNNAYTIALTGSTFQQKAAIYHWSVVSPTVGYSVADAADGRYIVANNVTTNADGSYHYEYAIFNYNSDSAGRSFSMPIPAGVTVSNMEFKDIAYHSGEPYNSTDWTMTNTGGVLKWECTETFAQNANANALRWSTLYNFSFDSSAAPGTGNAAIGLFKTGGSVGVSTKIPVDPCRYADLNCDGSVNGADLGILLSVWGPCPGGTPGCRADLDNNAVVNGADLGFMMGAWN
jgi:hypothetical protein